MSNALADLFKALHGTTLTVTLAAVAVAPAAAPQADATGHWRTPAIVRQVRYPLFITSGMSPNLTGANNVDLVIDRWEPPTGTLHRNSALDSLSPPKALLIRAISRLPVAVLSRMFDVSRQTYHAWMLGGPISSENADKINRALETVEVIAREHRDIAAFLVSRQFGTSAFDLIRLGRYDAAIGLSRYPDIAPSASIIAPLDWNDDDAGTVASFLYKGETQYARLDPDSDTERNADEALGVTTIVVDA